MIGCSQNLDRSLLTIISHHHTHTLPLLRREGIPNIRDCLNQFVPTDLFPQIAVILQSEILQRAAGCYRNDDSTHIQPGGH